eukprot:UN00337
MTATVRSSEKWGMLPRNYVEENKGQQIVHKSLKSLKIYGASVAKDGSVFALRWLVKNQMGYIPTKYPNSLISLDLSTSSLKGSIPNNLPVSLEKLILANNRLAGPIPKLPDSLQILDLTKP